MATINLAFSIGRRAIEAWRRLGLRRYLLEMDEQALADIGVSRAQALFELDRGEPQPAPPVSCLARRPSPSPRSRAT